MGTGFQKGRPGSQIIAELSAKKKCEMTIREDCVKLQERRRDKTADNLLLNTN
jgi:hypothetical protein